MTHDEAAFGAEAEMVLAGHYPIYFSLGYGHEPLYGYLVALAFAFLGRSLLALRVTSAACGLLVVVGTYLVGRALYGRRTAWIAAAWMAVAFWPLSLSRQALRAITLPMLWLPAVWWFWRGLHTTRLGGGPGDERPSRPRMLGYGVLAGLFLGLSFYTYMASRVAWVTFPLFMLYMLVRRRNRIAFKRTWPVATITLSVAVLIALPLVVYLGTHPSAEVRVDVMMNPIRELLRGKPGEVLRHTWDAVRVFSWIGDRFWAYNIPGQPVFNWIGSLAFYAGVARAAWHWREPRQAFLLIWLLVGLAPAMVTTNEGIYLRAIVAQPAAYLLVAEAFSAAYRGLRALTRRSTLAVAPFWLNAAWIVLALAVLGVEAGRTYRTYFIEWATDPEARMIYNHNLVATAQYLRDRPSQEAIGISALHPLYYHDPWIFRYVAQRPDLAVRWFDGRGGIVYPGTGEARYVFSTKTQLDPALRAEFEAGATWLEQQQLDPADENPVFDVWLWQGGDRLAQTLETVEATSPVWVSPETRFDQPALRQELQGEVQFGDLAALVGYRLNGTSFQPGDVVEVITYWRAQRTVSAEDDWATFVHLLDVDSNLIGSADVLDCPPTGWYPGDIVVQVHRFQVSTNSARGVQAYLELGLYRRSTGRLPVVVEGQAIADRLLLVPVEVR
jgi:4-amino-4-deoxy-L-arabinose transferase-like glycosyltransferase